MRVGSIKFYRLRLLSLLYSLFAIVVIYSCGSSGGFEGTAKAFKALPLDATEDATDNSPPIVEREFGIKVSTVAGAGTLTSAASLTDPKELLFSSDISRIKRKEANKYLISYNSLSDKLMELNFSGEQATLTERPISGLLPGGKLNVLGFQNDKSYIRYDQQLNGSSGSWNAFIFSLDSTYAATGLAGSAIVLGNGLGHIDDPVGLNAAISEIFDGVIVGDSLYFSTFTSLRKMELAAPNAVTTVAGSNSIDGSVDGIGRDARLRFLYTIALAPGNKIILGDEHLVREFDIATSMVKTIAGELDANNVVTAGHTDNTNPFDSLFMYVRSMAVSASGSVYLTEYNYPYIRKIEGNNGVYGEVSTIAGNGTEESIDTSADVNKRHDAKLASLLNPLNLFFEGDVLYFVDNKSLLRKVEFFDATP